MSAAIIIIIALVWLVLDALLTDLENDGKRRK